MNADDLAYSGAAAQAELVRSKAVSATEVVTATLDRIAAIDPALNAFRVVLADEALDAAAEIDRLVATGPGSPTAPLLGVPVAVKDDVDVAGEITGWGSAGNNIVKSTDSEMVARLRRAGAIVIGKTTCSELTALPFTETMAEGATRNPWDKERSPGGSSGGSGAAVASGLCGVASGSDGLGSVRVPAGFTGVFGVKPQRDRIPLGADHHDGWGGQLVFGPLARHVADAAAFLDATADDGPPGGFLAGLRHRRSRLRIALAPRPHLPMAATVRLGTDHRRALHDTARLLTGLGHRVVLTRVDYPISTSMNASTRYLQGVYRDLGLLADPASIEPRTRSLARMGQHIPAVAVRRARAAEAGLAKRINRVFDNADVVLMPGATGPPWRIGELDGRGAMRTLLSASALIPHFGPWNAIGQPAVSVPAGFDSLGLPIGVQLCGRPHDETTLLALAAQIEQARPWAHARPPI